MASHNNPLELLRAIERRSIEHAQELPRREVKVETWSGVGFRMGEQLLIAGTDEVIEILELPHVTAVPGTKSWVRGVANVRGELMPIMDLRGFVEDVRGVVGRRSRVLVIGRDTHPVGFVVEELLGQRHFPPEERRADMQGIAATLAPYADGRFEHGDERWTVIRLERLLEDPVFSAVAA